MRHARGHGIPNKQNQVGHRRLTDGTRLSPLLGFSSLEPESFNDVAFNDPEKDVAPSEWILKWRVCSCTFTSLMRL